MRHAPACFFACLAACASAPPGPAPRDVVPPENAPSDAEGRAPSDALAHLAEVFVGATCADLDTGKRAPHRTGFYANPRTVATDALLYDQAGGAIFPDFAVLDADGCRDGQYGNLYREFGLMFVRVHGPRHAGAMPLEDGPAAPRMAGFRYKGRGEDGRPRFERAVHKLPTRSGRLAGSPLFNAEGKCVAMVSNGITDDFFTDRPRPMTIPAVTIGKLLLGCGPCEDD